MSTHPVGPYSSRIMELQGRHSDPHIAPTDHQNIGGRPCSPSVEGCQKSDNLQKRRPIRICLLPMYICSLRSRKVICYDPAEQTLKPHHPKGGA